MRRPLFVNILRLLLMLIASSALGWGEQSEAERVLMSSHVARISIREFKRVETSYAIVEAAVREVIKGKWVAPNAIIAIALPLPPEHRPAQGDEYIVFCSEQLSDDLDRVFEGRLAESIMVPKTEAATVVSRLQLIVAYEKQVVEDALRSTALRRTDEFTERVEKIVALLYERATQKTAVRELLALPKAANKAIAMFLYDTRRIPEGLLSPDDVIDSSKSPYERCGCIQDVMIWIIGMRCEAHYGYINEGTSFATRSAIADSLIYRLYKEDGVR